MVYDFTVKAVNGTILGGGIVIDYITVEHLIEQGKGLAEAHLGKDMVDDIRICMLNPRRTPYEIDDMRHREFIGKNLYSETVKDVSDHLTAVEFEIVVRVKKIKKN